MNLFQDPWIAVKGPVGVKLIGLEELLCSHESFVLCLPRDDMELSTLQLAICLTQVAIMPENLKELKDRIKQPLDKVEYRQRIEKFIPWFQLDHPEWPFMQTVNVSAKETTPIQKLLPGLPEGNNHCFFNNPGEIRVLGASMTAVALFQQASTAPSFGGGFKYPLRARGAAVPLTTLIWDEDLRKMVWTNTLSHDKVLNFAPDYSIGSEAEIPTWVKPVKDIERVAQIGLLRGLFWQPAHIKLEWEQIDDTCDLIGTPIKKGCKTFIKEKFNYSMDGIWSHPHSPRDFEKGFLALRANEPSWTNCYAYVYKDDDLERAGHIPAAVVSQAKMLKSGQALHLIVGGYCNNQANVIERRHEMLSLGVGWERQDAERLKSIIELLLDMRKNLSKKLYWLKKARPEKKLRGVGVDLTAEANRMFYQETEQLVREGLQKFTFQEAKVFQDELKKQCYSICLNIYDDVTAPFQHDTGMVAAIAEGRRSLGILMRAGMQSEEKKKNKTKEVK